MEHRASPSGYQVWQRPKQTICLSSFGPFLHLGLTVRFDSYFDSLVGLIAVIIVYFYISAKGDPELLEKTAIYCSVALTLTCVASFSAVGVSLSTYALAHQFYTGGAYYVKV